MTDEQNKQADAILADAADPKVSRWDVLHRLTKLGQVVGGDDRHELGTKIYSALDRRAPW
jgi:hypothetical protein